MKEFELGKRTDEVSKLLEEIRREFQKAGLDTADLPRGFDQEKLKLVFVGQYSAGKSSLIKMLTGADLKIGASITTDKAKPYSWHGIEVIDTPGILTDMPSDHDAKTYDQINHAALLIFVITGEGFSQYLGDHFRKLAIEQKRGGNMVLVVNKMDRTALGNVEEQQHIIADDLRKVTQPYAPEDLYVSFVSTENYFEGANESDPELKQELIELSGYEEFVENLNKFVESRAVLSKVAKPLYTAADRIRSALDELSSDRDSLDLAETLNQRKRILLEGRKACMRDIRDIASRCRTKIADRGREAAELIAIDADEFEIKKAYGKIQQEIEEYVIACGEEANECVTTTFNNIQEEIAAYDDTTFVRNVNARVSNRINAVRSAGENAAQVGSNFLKALAPIIANFNNPEAVAVGVPTMFAKLAGSGAGLIVDWGLKSQGLGVASKLISGGIGAAVTKFFTPEPSLLEKGLALFSRNAGAIGQVLGAAGAVWQIIAEYKKGEEQRSIEARLQEERVKVLDNFMEIGNGVYDQLIKGMEQWLKESIDPIVAGFDEGINTLRQGRANAAAANSSLRALLRRTENTLGTLNA